MPISLLIFILFLPIKIQALELGETVQLIKRDIGIPAHPAPGDDKVSFKFVSESQAIILAVDETTSWVHIRGTSIEAIEKEGWITQRYILKESDHTHTSFKPGETTSNTTAVSTVSNLDWCPEKRSSLPSLDGKLRLATWNIENLHAQDNQSIFHNSEKRKLEDYERIRCYIRLFDPDILAVQEIDGEAALKRVIDIDVYNIVVSQRSKSNNMNGKQNTGFIYKKGLEIEVLPDFSTLDVINNGSLRYGTQILLNYQGKTIKLMSVHLKSKCFSNNERGKDCSKLFNQIKVLEEWIDEAAASEQSFILLGDFNRRFNLPEDKVWLEIDDGNPPNADLTTVTDDTMINCRNNYYTSFIDHIVFDKTSIAFVVEDSFQHINFRKEDETVWDKISDHCPVIIDLWLP